ncbi:MAG: YeiH family protein [Cyanobacteria bacterium P01_G01_bin.38]
MLRLPVSLGLILTTTLTLLVYFLHSRHGFEALGTVSLAILIGIAVSNLFSIPKTCRPGIKFSLKKVLNLAIILLGLRFSLSEIATVGFTGLVIITLALLATFTFTYWFGKRLGLNPQVVQLIAAGTSICGTSAIVATNGVVKGSEDDVACAIATVTAFGAIAMVLYPMLPDILHLTPEGFGLWCGSSIHQTAQVVAAGFQQGAVSGEFATIAKLSRVMFLAPIVFFLGIVSIHEKDKIADLKQRQLPIPWFILMFLGLVCLNTLGLIPANLKEPLIVFDKFLITMAMVAVGLETNLFQLKRAGLKPLYLGAASWLCLSGISLGLIKLLGV